MAAGKKFSADSVAAKFLSKPAAEEPKEEEKEINTEAVQEPVKETPKAEQKPVKAAAAKKENSAEKAEEPVRRGPKKKDLTEAQTYRIYPRQNLELRKQNVTKEKGDMSAMVRYGIDIVTGLSVKDYNMLNQAAEEKGITPAELLAKALRAYLKSE